MFDNTKLHWREKVGYSLGDMASNFYWRVFDLFLFIFYTDVFGLSAAAVGTMMLVTRLFDAISDPLMGALADRTTTRFGKFRPYLLWGAIPLAVAGVLTFTVPDTDPAGQYLWAFGTYTFMMLAYTFINVPYGALMGVMTGDSQQRTQLTSFRFIAAFSGGTLVAYLTPELVILLGNGDDITGWQLTMACYGTVAIILFATTFMLTRERIQPFAIRQSSVWQDIRDLGHNKPWQILFLLALVIMITISLRGSAGTFYLKYYVGREDLIGAFSMVYMLSLAVGAAMTPLLCKYVEKRQLLMLLMGTVTLCSVVMYFVPADQLAVIFVLQCLIGLGLGPKSPLVFSMYADTADYGEWKLGRRATAMIFSAAAFAQKLGGALAGATIGWVLASMGYVANQAQSDASQSGILLLMTVIPAFFTALSVVIAYRYSLNQSELNTIHQSLAGRGRKR
ncbi:MFS transporter [Alteromonas sp. 14N.309.X.WAT.G.H12]|uniref:MFS transporter n=1 Tax=Alteromonas sp. 14N.309.X.WAT.G.H12 TaxID=3120824 RepID=UPI002FD51195